MASASLNDLTPDTRERVDGLIASAWALGLEVDVVSTLRSCADQGTSTVPVIVQGMSIKRAPGCRSWHVWGRAVDIQLRTPTADRYKQLGELGESLGLQWGGRFVSNPDPIHFQYPGGFDIRTLCPNPDACAAAVAAGAGVPSPVPVPAPAIPPAIRAIHMLIGAAVGWFAVRVLWKQK